MLYEVKVIENGKIVEMAEEVPYETISLIVQSRIITVDGKAKHVEHVSIGLHGKVRVLLP